MLPADQPEPLRLDRLAVPLHRCEQPGDAGMVDLVVGEEHVEPGARQAQLVEHGRELGGAGQTAEVADKIAQQPDALTVLLIAVDAGRNQALQSFRRVPVRRNLICRSPLLPVRRGRFRPVDAPPSGSLTDSARCGLSAA